VPRSRVMLNRFRRGFRLVRDVVLIVLIGIGMLYLIRLIECRAKLPGSRVVALVYDQTSDTFSIETEPIPWWSVRGLSSKIEIRTVDNEGERDGLYPHPRFRSREIVDYPDPTMDQYYPGYILSKDLPHGKALSPTKPWKMASGVVRHEGHWRLIFESVHLNDTDVHRPIRVAQFRNYYPAQSPDDNAYAFYIQAMGPLGARGYGRGYEPTIRQRVRHVMMDVVGMFQ